MVRSGALPVKTPVADEAVACGTCTACCRDQAVFLRPGDFAPAYDTEEAFDPIHREMGRVLKKREDGSCVYLGASGCTIYERRPKICRAFSCVGMVRDLKTRITRAQMRRDFRNDPVFQAGQARLGQ